MEFGAGRGKLSHWIHEALKTQETLKTQEALKTQVALKTQEDLQLLLVERSSTRFKVGTLRFQFLGSRTSETHKVQKLRP